VEQNITVRSKSRSVKARVEEVTKYLNPSGGSPEMPAIFMSDQQPKFMLANSDDSSSHPEVLIQALDVKAEDKQDRPAEA